MKRIVSILLSAAMLVAGITCVSAAESPITGTAETGKYTWIFGENADGTAGTTYDLTDEDYADIRVSLGSGDSITSSGICFSAASVKETDSSGYTSVSDTGRYILIKPVYSGTLYITTNFPSAGTSQSGRFYCYDFGNATDFDTITNSYLSTLYKNVTGSSTTTSQTTSASVTSTITVEAGHIYALYSYIYNSSKVNVTALYYTSSDITARTNAPTINEPVSSTDTAISGTCPSGAAVSVTINDGTAQAAEVSGTEWTLTGLALNAGDVISVTAQINGKKVSSAATATVLDASNILKLTINNPENGSIVSNQSDNSKIISGTEVTLTVTPDTGYKLSSLVVGGENVTDSVSDEAYTFTMTADTEVSAVFEEKMYYTVSLPSNTEHGAVTIESGAESDNKAVSGTKITLAVTPDDGYRIKTLTYSYNGESYNIKYLKAFEMPDADVTVTAEFAEEQIISDVDTSYETYDRITLNIDDEPFFYNGVQIRADKVASNWGYTDENIEAMFNQAGEDGFTVVNTQIHWAHIQPDTAVDAEIESDDTSLSVSADNSVVLIFSLPETESTETPTTEPTATPTAEPTVTPTTEPTTDPTENPTDVPTTEPDESVVSYDSDNNLVYSTLSGTLIICNYSNGTLVNTDIQAVSANESITPKYDITDGTKIFLWDSIESMKPLAAAFEYESDAENISLSLLESDNDTSATTYAAAKIRIYASEISSASPRVYGIDEDGDKTDLGTLPDYDPMSSSAYYDFDVTDFVNEHIDAGEINFEITADNGSFSINNGATTSYNSPQLVLSRDDVYDWTYVDKMIDYAEESGVKLEILWFAIDTCQVTSDSRVPYYVMNNYQKSLAEDGTPLRSRGTSYTYVMCKNDEALREKEYESLQALFDHIAEYDQANGGNHTVVGCQITNEPATARTHTNDDYHYNERCHCDVCEAKYESIIADGGTLQDYLNDTMWNYENSLGLAVKESDYSVWTRVNNYGGTDANLVVYNEEKRENEGTSIDFIGYDPYSTDMGVMFNFGNTYTSTSGGSINYSYGNNLPMIMENGGSYSNSAALTMAALAGGSFYNMYELCGPDGYGMYVDTDKDGVMEERGDYADEIRAVNSMLNKIAVHLASKKADGAAGDTLVFFNELSNNSESDKKMIRAVPIVYTSEDNGVGTAIEASETEIVLTTTADSEFTLTGISQYGISSVETGYYDSGEWVKESDYAYSTDGDNIVIGADAYSCIRVTTKSAIASAEDYSPSYTYDAETNTYTYDFSLFANARSLSTSATISNLTVYGTSSDYINPGYAVYYTSNGNSTSEGGIWWNGKISDADRYMIYTPECNGTLKIRLRNTYNKGSGTTSWLRYGTEGAGGTNIGYNGTDLLSQEYSEFTVELTSGTTYYFWPVGGGVNISSVVFTPSSSTE
ncbi:MAG: DUF4978 domain-containing protein [Firmicutes bacterium]|nr:DUF4978 domain-containing protein [Bacillota bacterium]